MSYYLKIGSCVPDQDPLDEIEVSNIPSWLSCEIQPTTDKAHLLRLKVAAVPPALPVQDVLHIARKDGTLLRSTLRVNVLAGDVSDEKAAPPAAADHSKLAP